MTSIYTYRQGVSIPHGRAVPLIQASQPLTGETSHHKYSRCLDLLRGRRPPIWDIPLRRESHNWDIPLRRESHNWDIPLRRESHNRDISLRRESHNWDIPLRSESPESNIPLRREVPVLKRSSTETFQLTRMSPFRPFFTEMYYYNRCSDLLRKSLPHATINWCHWLDFKKRCSSYLFWVGKISQGTTF
jgi:hypothetical protein